jgi:hypothetical protein
MIAGIQQRKTLAHIRKADSVSFVLLHAVHRLAIFQRKFDPVFEYMHVHPYPACVQHLAGSVFETVFKQWYQQQWSDHFPFRLAGDVCLQL